MSSGHFRNVVTSENVREIGVLKVTVHLTISELLKRPTFASGGQFAGFNLSGGHVRKALTRGNSHVAALRLEYTSEQSP